MFRLLFNKKSTMIAVCCTLATVLVTLSAARTIKADELTGRELLSITRVAQGGAEYKSLEFITSKSTGFVNIAPIAGAGLGTGGAMAVVEVKLNLIDYQDKNSRRRLEVTPTGGLSSGATFLVYTGSTGGGMYMGNEFRVTDSSSSRHWGLMGFNTLNRAVDGQLQTLRQRDEVSNYVVEVRFNSEDIVRYWIDKNSFLISKVVTLYNGRVMLEEERSDYRKANCMMLPFRIVTKLGGQRLADLTIDSYDLKSEVPSTRFTVVVIP